MIAEKPAYPPGEKYAYSNVGYTIAGAMAEKVTGATWEDLVKREVFEPLKLTDAGFGPPKSPDETLEQPRGHRVVLGWKVPVDDDEDNTPIMGPAGTVHMTLENLCTYATEHLRGELGKGKLLSAETYKRLHTPELNDYACGWVRKEPTKEIPYTVYWHNGSNTMWYALVVFIPEKNMVVAVTSNDGDIEKAEAAAWEVVKASVNQFNVEGDLPRRKSLQRKPAGARLHPLDSEGCEASSSRATASNPAPKMIACLIVPCTMAFLRVVRSAPQSDKRTRSRKQQQGESRWLRYSCTRRLSVRAAASGLVELGTPGVVVGLCVRVSQALAPDDVVTRINKAIIIEVAGQRGTHDLKYQGAGNLAQVDHQIVIDRRDEG